MYRYDVDLLKGVFVVEERRKLRGNKVSETVWPGGSFEGASNINIEGVGTGEVDPLGI